MAKRGRKPLKDEDRKSAPVGIRLTKALRSQLEEARGERTLSQEIELRLRQSFEMENEIKRRFGGAEIYWLLQLMASGMNEVAIWFDSEKGVYKKSLFKDRYIFDQTKVMMIELLDHFRPKGRSKPPKHSPVQRAYVQSLGRRTALATLALLETIRNNAGRTDLPVELFAAMHPVGIYLKGSPLEESANLRRFTEKGRDPVTGRWDDEKGNRE